MKTFILSLIGSAVLVGCSDTPLSPDLLTVTATVAPNPLQSGDTATVVVSLANHTPFSVSVGGTECPFAFEVVDQSGAVVGGPAPQFCVADLVSRVMMPGDRVSQTFRWTADAPGGGPLQPGTYSVRGLCQWVTRQGSSEFTVSQRATNRRSVVSVSNRTVEADG